MSVKQGRNIKRGGREGKICERFRVRPPGPLEVEGWAGGVELVEQFLDLNEGLVHGGGNADVEREDALVEFAQGLFVVSGDPCPALIEDMFFVACGRDAARAQFAIAAGDGVKLFRQLLTLPLNLLDKGHFGRQLVVVLEQAIGQIFVSGIGVVIEIERLPHAWKVVKFAALLRFVDHLFDVVAIHAAPETTAVASKLLGLLLLSIWYFAPINKIHRAPLLNLHHVHVLFLNSRAGGARPGRWCGYYTHTTYQKYAYEVILTFVEVPDCTMASFFYVFFLLPIISVCTSLRATS